MIIIFANAAKSSSMSKAAPTFYELLGLKGWESQSDVRRAFLQRALQYHPDKRTTEATNDEAFNLFVTAYKTLYDPGLRAQYDSSLQKKKYTIYTRQRT